MIGRHHDSSIGIFDSGVGGLSVLRSLLQELPNENVYYFGDQIHVPYGTRTLEEVREYSIAITRFLLELGAKIIVVACNTASAAALQFLRDTFPNTPFVGMEPAIKPAAENTRTGIVGVLATPATFQGALYASVIERFASNVLVVQNTCPGLVQQIERGAIEADETRRILESAILPMMDQGIDTIVLGCTHYPFVIPLINDIVGPNVRVIDPAPAVARQVARVLEEKYWKNLDLKPGRLIFYTSGKSARFIVLLKKLLNETHPAQEVSWDNFEIRIKEIC